MVSRMIDLVIENETLRDEAKNLRRQRKEERAILNEFVNQAQQLDSTLPPTVKTDDYHRAVEQLYQASVEYTSIAVKDETDREIATHDTVPVVDALRRAYDTLQTNIVVEIDSSRHDASRKEQLQEALAKLQNNSASFRDFLVSYVNGRQHRLLVSKIRRQIKSLLAPYFADPPDVRQLTERIVDTIETGLKVDTEEMKDLSKDIQVPLLAVLSVVISMLERGPETEAHGHLATSENMGNDA